MTSATDNANLFCDFSSIAPNTVDLSEDSIAWATRVCRDMKDGEDQWQAFLRALAVAGFEQWLNGGARAFKSRFNPEDTSQAALPRQGINFWVEGYRLCLLVVGSLYERTIDIITGGAEEMAHVYVLVQVQEEVNQVKIVAGLQREQLLQLVKNDLRASNHQMLGNHRSSHSAWSVPIAQFETPPEQLLLQLSCLAPAAVAAPVVASASQVVGLGAIAHKVINVGQWLQGQLDEVSAQLGWVLLPPMAAESALRPVKNDDIETTISQLANLGVQLPAPVVMGTLMLTIGSFTGCLYASGWPTANSADDEWNLVVLLGPPDNADLPEGIQLKVSDATQLLETSTLDRTTEAEYLYVQVRGTTAETFSVEITLPDGQTQTLSPPFGF